MTKKAHKRQLERARAKREAALHERKQRHVRMVALGLVILLVGGLVVGLVASSGDTPEPEIVATDDPDLFATDDPDPFATDDAADPSACDTTRPASADAEKPQWDAPPEMQIDPARAYTATISTTCGDIDLELFAADAPVTVNSFVFLARNDFYDGVPFHRTIEGFMIQGGDPTGTGSGGPGYSFEDELDTVAKYGVDRGRLAMANAGPNTNGSQFFIIQGDASHLTTHTVFGSVTAGMDVVDAIAAMPAGLNGAVDAPVWILDVTIEEA